METTKSALLVRAFLLIFALSGTSFAADRNWSGSVSTDWHDPLNWAESSVPEANDDVIIDGSVTHQPTLDLSEGPITIASLSIGTTKASTLTFSYGDVETKKLIVTGDVLIGPSGILTHSVNATEETHRLFLDVGGDMEIVNKGLIDTQGKGFTKGPDEMTGSGRGQSHGGHGAVTALVYGSIVNPVSIGCSDVNNGGGGAIKLHVAGSLLINGTISSTAKARGAGGSVLIDADTIAGTGSIQVNGNTASSGGRIALYYNSKTFTGKTTADGAQLGAAGTIFTKNKNESYGHLSVSNTVVSSNFTYLINPNISGEPLHLQSITAHDKARIFVGVNITADNYVTEKTGLIKKWSDPDMLGANPDTWWTGTVDTNWYNGANWSSGTVPGPGTIAVVEGRYSYVEHMPYLAIENKNENLKALGVGNSILHINCPFDEENNWRLILNEDLILAPGGFIAHCTNNTSAEHFRVNIEAKNMHIDTRGGIELSKRGRSSGGLGGGTSTASYGGQGFHKNASHGSIVWPIILGSASSRAGNVSGGAGKFVITGVANIDGFIKTDGYLSTGGSILLLCDTFSGLGTLTANVESGSSGGRIAIYYREKTFTGTISAYGGIWGGGSASGTIYEKPEHLEHGILIVLNNVSSTPVFTSLNDVEAVDCIFDEILISGTGKLLVGADDSLTLPEDGIMIIEENDQASVNVVENGVFNNAGTIELPGKENSLNIEGNLNNFPGSLVRYTGIFNSDQNGYVLNDFDYYNMAINAPGNIFFWNAGKIYNINGQLEITGEPDNLITLRSTEDGTPWNLLLTDEPGYAEYVDVMDSHAHMGKGVRVGPLTDKAWELSINSGNNINWIFGVSQGTIFVFY